MSAIPEKEFVKAFWSFVEKTEGGCWEWRGTLLNNGYGTFRKHRTHRLSWTIANQRDIPPGFGVCHHCDNPKCVRPSHLFLGTQKDNMADAVSKGRAIRGERVNNAKLTSDQVRQIKRLLRLKQITIREITALYPVAYNAITDIKRGDTWAWLKEEE